MPEAPDVKRLFPKLRGTFLRASLYSPFNRVIPFLFNVSFLQRVIKPSQLATPILVWLSLRFKSPSPVGASFIRIKKEEAGREVRLLGC